MTEYLYLYGTLMPNEADNEVAHVVRRLRRVGAAYVRGRLYNLGEYPELLLMSQQTLRFAESWSNCLLTKQYSTRLIGMRNLIP
jgi:hypothetical protein